MLKQALFFSTSLLLTISTLEAKQGNNNTLSIDIEEDNETKRIVVRLPNTQFQNQPQLSEENNQPSSQHQNYYQENVVNFIDALETSVHNAGDEKLSHGFKTLVEEALQNNNPSLLIDEKPTENTPTILHKEGGNDLIKSVDPNEQDKILHPNSIISFHGEEPKEEKVLSATSQSPTLFEEMLLGGRTRDRVAHNVHTESQRFGECLSNFLNGKGWKYNERLEKEKNMPPHEKIKADEKRQKEVEMWGSVISNVVNSLSQEKN